MQEERNKVITTVRKLLVETNLANALDTLYNLLCGIDPVLADEVTLLQQRLNRVESDRGRQVITYENYQLELNRISASVLYMLNQIPEVGTAPRKTGKKKKKGKLLHDIPPKMPIGLETKCTVRIAESEAILLEGYGWTINTELEDISITKVMEVELIDFGEEKNFSIRTFSESEQPVEEEEFTQWLFFVKPLHSGVHTLYLKVSTIQYINEKERKKEVVLERKVNVVSEPGGAMGDAGAREWHDTKIALSPKAKKKAAGQSRKKAKSGKIFIAKKSDTSGLYTHEPKEQAGWDDLKGDIFKHTKGPDSDFFDPFADRPKGPEPGGGGKIFRMPGKWDTTGDSPGKSDSGASNKHSYQITDELNPKEVVKSGAMIKVRIDTSGFRADKLEFFIDQKGVNPAEKKGNRFTFHVLTAKATFSFAIMDTESGESVTRELRRDRNYHWVVKRKKNRDSSC